MPRTSMSATEFELMAGVMADGTSVDDAIDVASSLRRHTLARQDLRGTADADFERWLEGKEV